LIEIGINLNQIENALEKNFFHIGGNSMNAIVLIFKLKEKKFAISIECFLNAKTIREIVDLMMISHEQSEILKIIRSIELNDKTKWSRYQVKSLYYANKKDVISLMAKSLVTFNEVCIAFHKNCPQTMKIMEEDLSNVF